MSGDGRFSIPGRLRSFRHAFAGLAFTFRTQHNAWIHAAATLAVFALAAGLRVGRDEWLWLVAAVALVWIAELVNTAFEHLCDVVSPELHASVKAAKDVAAAAVLVAAATAVVIGVMVFAPRLAG